MDDLVTRVRRGIALLDEVCPDHDWRSDISLKALDMTHKQWCILGQLYRTYNNGLDVLFPIAPYHKQKPIWEDPHRNDPAHYGFRTVDESESYDDLQAVWIQELIHC
jgi:hypothetical protein